MNDSVKVWARIFDIPVLMNGAPGSGAGGLSVGVMRARQRYSFAVSRSRLECAYAPTFMRRSRRRKVPTKWA